MGTDVGEVVEKLPSPFDIKVHRGMCTELTKMVTRVLKIFPEIEAARPRCSSGIKSLCLLNNAIDKARLLIQDCSESSKLYLALTGNTILTRCERSKSLLEQSLSQIQNMVPVTLASEIAQIIGELNGVTFSLDLSDEAAGKAVKAALEQYKTGGYPVKEPVIERIRIAASKLRITSQKALLIERRSIKKLLVKLGDNDDKQSKKQILFFLLDMSKRCGKSIAASERPETENDRDFETQKVDLRESQTAPFTEFSTDTDAWVDENSSSSIDSLTVSMQNLRLPVDYSYVSLGSVDDSRSLLSSDVENGDDSVGFRSLADDARVLDVELPNVLDGSVSWEIRCNEVEVLTTGLKNKDRVCESEFSEDLVGSIVRFLNAAWEIRDVKAQQIGCRLLLILVDKCRSVVNLSKDAYRLLATFLESEAIEEALAILEALSSHRDENARREIAESGALTPIFKILDTRIPEIQSPALKILRNVTLSKHVRPLVDSADLVPKLVPFFEDDSLSSYCIAILANLRHDEGAGTAVAETDGCLPFVCTALESESFEDQERALEILLSLCSRGVRYCRLAMNEGVIPAVVLIGVNGNDRGRAKAKEMLRLLKDVEYDDGVEEPAAPDSDVSVVGPNGFRKEKKTSSRASRIFSMISRSSLGQKRRI